LPTPVKKPVDKPGGNGKNEIGGGANASHLSEDVMMTTYAANSVSSEDTQSVKLTKREVEVLTLVIEGKSSKEVADQLFVSKRTVDFHLANIYEKLNVTNRVQAFREATRLNLIPFNIVGTQQ
jgi:DNA-binding NarL/FixJ family response regulator